MSNIEASFSAFVQQLEEKQSLLSQHELRKLDDLKKAKLRSDTGVSETVEEKIVEKAQDVEDAARRQLLAFQPAPTTTTADQEENTASLARCLDRKLILIVQPESGRESYQLPETSLAAGETLRSAAERLLSETLRPHLRPRILGSAPFGLYKAPYSRKIREQTGVAGAKVFLMKAQLSSMDSGATCTDKVKAYEWLSLDQVKTRLNNNYFKSLSKIIIE